MSKHQSVLVNTKLQYDLSPEQERILELDGRFFTQCEWTVKDLKREQNNSLDPTNRSSELSAIILGEVFHLLLFDLSKHQLLSRYIPDFLISKFVENTAERHAYILACGLNAVIRQTRNTQGNTMEEAARYVIGVINSIDLRSGTGDPLGYEYLRCACANALTVCEHLIDGT